MRVASVLRAILLLGLVSWPQILPFQRIVDDEVRFKFEIAVVSAFGNPISDAEVTIHPSNAPDTAIRWTRDLKLAPGRHRFTVRRGGFRSFESDLLLTEDGQRFFACMHLVPIGTRPSVIGQSDIDLNPVYGRLSGDRESVDACDAVVVFPVFCGTGGASTAHFIYRGGFGFDHLDPGLYTFVVLAGDKPCATRTIPIEYNPRQTIRIEVDPRRSLIP